jgi:glyoxylase I family protein
MVKVLGIGGFFFRSENPRALAEWYQVHLGINLAPNDQTMTPWVTESGMTVFAPFEKKTDYFAKNQAFMLNFRVGDLDAAIAELGAAGIASSHESSMEGVGRFARIHDPEGTPIELWEPTKA